jgi:hypothetical protein
MVWYILVQNAIQVYLRIYLLSVAISRVAPTVLREWTVIAMAKIKNTMTVSLEEFGKKSDIYPEEKILKTMRECRVPREVADSSMWRTHFTYKGYFFSVIYGYGSYGYYDGKLECMIGGEEPEGGLTAEDVLKRMEDIVCQR